MRKLIAIGSLSYLLIGLAMVLTGAVLEPVIAHYGLDYKMGSLWITDQFVGYMIGVLAAPLLTSRIGKRSTLVIAFGCLTVAEAAYSMLLPWSLMLVIAPLAGIGFGAAEAIVGATIIELSEENKKASNMATLEVFFGVGALIMPIGAAYLIHMGVWQVTFPVLTAISGITMLLWLTLSFGKADDQIGWQSRTEASAEPAKQSESESALGSSKQALAHGEKRKYDRKVYPFLLFGMLFFLAYVGMEMSFSNYLPSFLMQRTGAEETSAASILSVFWLFMVIGRLFVGRIADRIGFPVYLILSAASTVAVLAVSALTMSFSGLVIWTCLAGLTMSGMFAVGLVYVNSRSTAGMTERTTSLMVAAGGIGGALFPRISGWLMDSYGTTATMWSIACMAVFMVAVFLLMVLAGKRLKAS
ncbi:MFS transporter [Paenibacillus sp. MMS18-CY102]|uniref:MFS transporter n=1 Tax=Paenibacillus sp. MMS18-CY102 TaxID=2682849 RepID=UPI001365F99A|nr:MFS transporter [Paenibacillus sp. MMS18-CY102]MWC30736.1 MFS transporter [Paenibacillus sp. MMS18-CY102]